MLRHWLRKTQNLKEFAESNKSCAEFNKFKQMLYAVAWKASSDRQAEGRILVVNASEPGVPQRQWVGSNGNDHRHHGNSLGFIQY